MNIIFTQKKRLDPIFPNPTESKITINYKCNNKTFNYNIYDFNGSLLESSKEIFTGGNSLTLDFSSYPSGIYFLKIFCGNDTTTYKIIKEM